jgi:UDP-N-acetylmuramate dehydrogenase
VISVRHDVSGAELTTLHVGGICSTVVDVATSEDLESILLVRAVAVCIGGGSNLIIADTGFAAPLVRAWDALGTDLFVDEATGEVDAGASVDWDALVARTVNAGLAGLECTSGVPGSVGGALVQNLGAYGQEIADRVESIDVFDRIERRVLTMGRDECGFAYRTSRFKHDLGRQFVVLRVRLRLDVRSINSPRYGEVFTLLRSRSGDFAVHDEFPIADIRTTVLEVRRKKGMLLGASKPSAGSFFTNPEIPDDLFRRLEGRPGIKAVMRTAGTVRLSAAALMEGVGFRKGDSFGAVGLSPLHVLALVNLGGATASNVLEVAARVCETVVDQFGITLTPEPVVLG